MYYGFLSPEVESTIVSIMHEYESVKLVDREVIFDMPSGIRYRVKIVNLPKPMKIGAYHERNISVIMKKCVLLEFDNQECYPIYKGGDIFVNAVPDGSDIPRRTHLKSYIAASFFKYALTVYGRLGGIQ